MNMKTNAILNLKIKMETVLKIDMEMEHNLKYSTANIFLTR
jgi:hypothetical protein